LDIDYPTHVIEIDGDDDGWTVATTTNAVRRHMSLDARRAAVKDLRARGFSLRSIARAMGVDDKTVRNDLSRSGAEGSAPESVRGADGKEYPATRPPAPEVEPFLAPFICPACKLRFEREVVHCGNDHHGLEVTCSICEPAQPAPAASSASAEDGGGPGTHSTASPPSSPVEPIVDDEADCKHRYGPWELDNEDGLEYRQCRLCEGWEDRKPRDPKYRFSELRARLHGAIAEMPVDAVMAHRIHDDEGDWLTAAREAQRWGAALEAALKNKNLRLVKDA
jgi:transposase-like protein